MSISAQRGGLLEGVLLATIATAGFLYANLMPVMIHALMEGTQASRQAAATVASANAYGTAFGNLVGVWLVSRVPLRAFANSFLLALVALDASSTLAVSIPLVAAFRLLHGLCGGALVAIGFTLIGRTPHAERNFGLLVLLQCFLAGAGIIVLPQFSSNYGTFPLFATLMAFDVLALAALSALDIRPNHTIQRTTPSRGRKAQKTRLVVLTLIGIFAFQTAKFMVGTHVIDLGLSKGLSLADVTSAVGMADWSAILGALWLSAYPRD